MVSHLRYIGSDKEIVKPKRHIEAEHEWNRCEPRTQREGHSKHVETPGRAVGHLSTKDVSGQLLNASTSIPPAA